MLTHQKLRKFGIFRCNAVLPAKNMHVLAAQLGMVAAPAFGNVMKQRGDVQNPGLVPACGKLRAHGVFVRMLGHKKPPHIAQHHQDVLVHGVHMKQVVLHLPDDFAKHPQVAPQHRCLVHQPQRVGDAFGLLQDA